MLNLGVGLDLGLGIGFGQLELPGIGAFQQLIRLSLGSVIRIFFHSSFASSAHFFDIRVIHLEATLCNDQ